MLGSQRADLYGMVPAGKALAAEFGLAETYPKASVGYAAAALPSANRRAASASRDAEDLADYAAKGVPADLVEAAKRSEVAAAEFRRNSIPGLAKCGRRLWQPKAALLRTKTSKPSRRVTLADVNRVAKQYLVDQNSITATLKPVPTGEPWPQKGFGGAEQLTRAPTKPVELPSWAAAYPRRARKCLLTASEVSDTTLPNGFA